jgi:hypothetical protein
VDQPEWVRSLARLARAARQVQRGDEAWSRTFVGWQLPVAALASNPRRREYFAHVLAAGGSVLWDAAAARNERRLAELVRQAQRIALESR